jgi:hypothetical protein
MKILSNRIAQAAAVAALLAPAATSIAVAKDQVPLKGSLTIVKSTIPDDFQFPILTQTRDISGLVSHLGRTEGTIVQHINVLNGHFMGEFTLFAANGDSVTGEVSGRLIPTADPNVRNVQETITITGGSGRFTGATGAATGQGQAFVDTGLAQETFEGTISSPGS